MFKLAVFDHFAERLRPQLVGEREKSITTNWGNKKNFKKSYHTVIRSEKMKNFPSISDFFAAYSQW
jgi:hypothetical protein